MAKPKLRHRLRSIRGCMQPSATRLPSPFLPPLSTPPHHSATMVLQSAALFDQIGAAIAADGPKLVKQVGVRCGAVQCKGGWAVRQQGWAVQRVGGWVLVAL